LPIRHRIRNSADGFRQCFALGGKYARRQRVGRVVI
jgi:hypothetical protein